ncbi:MAG: type II toxin-antitoxin system VapC family toxin [bacterium]
MEWIAKLQGKVVGLDTAPLIYFVEENPAYLDATRVFFEAMDRGEFRVITSMVTLIEVLIHPFRSNNHELAETYRDIILNAENLSVIKLSHNIAEKAALLRADYDIRTPDAIQMATAVCAGASFFLTNDTRLPFLSGLKILQLNKLA